MQKLIVQQSVLLTMQEKINNFKKFSECKVGEVEGREGLFARKSVTVAFYE